MFTTNQWICVIKKKKSAIALTEVLMAITAHCYHR